MPLNSELKYHPLNVIKDFKDIEFSPKYSIIFVFAFELKEQSDSVLVLAAKLYSIINYLRF